MFWAATWINFSPRFRPPPLPTLKNEYSQIMNSLSHSPGCSHAPVIVAAYIGGFKL